MFSHVDEVWKKNSPADMTKTLSLRTVDVQPLMRQPNAPLITADTEMNTIVPMKNINNKKMKKMFHKQFNQWLNKHQKREAMHGWSNSQVVGIICVVLFFVLLIVIVLRLFHKS